MTTNQPKRKQIRLHEEVYSDTGRSFSVTICTAYNQPVFSNRELANLLWKHLIRYFNSNAKLYAACLMPDHFHLLVSPTKKNLIPLIGSLKSYTAKLMKDKGIKMPLWQRSFYDHAIRTNEDLNAAARYIVENPARKGLCLDYRNYPHFFLRQ